jgi:hypothetical protein
MSTILKTLRKLEEEKNNLNHKLDLKGMLLKEDKPYQGSIKLDRRNFFLLIVIVISLLIIGGAVSYHWSPNLEIPNPTKHVSNETPAEKTHPLSNPSRLRTFEGVPMASISNNEAVSKPGAKKHILSKQIAKLMPKKVPQISTYDNVEEINNLIRSKNVLTKNKPTISSTIQSGRIPGVKIKGIIFFDKDSPSNHIIATTKNNSNLKLRVGEAIQDVVLKSIHPNYVIFLSHDQLTQVSIGR